MPSDQPDLISSELDGCAVAMHELFMSYVRAGFTRDEALTLVMNHQTQWANEPEEGQP